jgi:hypothetical protein
MIEPHVRKRGHENVKPTIRMLRYWWGKLNAEVFHNELLLCQITYGRSEFAEVSGLCYPLDNGRSRIHIDNRNHTRAGMLGTLAHEMVHQYQHQNGLAMNHGETFERWSDPILGLTGLII